MRIYKNVTVYEEALNRIRWLFDEFKNISVNVSGGKDSTVIFNLALIVAKEKDRLPLQVNFVDQEAEWSYTVEEIKKIMYRDDVIPKWYQVPFKLNNATSFDNLWLKCWDEEHPENWLREKDPIAIKDPIPGVDLFWDFFRMVSLNQYPDEPCVKLTGIRCEESPRRTMGLTEQATYKWVTWGKMEDKKRQHFSFHPLYDWSYRDIWKAIHDNKWHYNKIYDFQYMYGVDVTKMRVSSLFHETAVHNLFYLQEADAELYNKLTKRLQGIDTAGKFGKADYFVTKLPHMFKDWPEYRNFLLDKLVTDKKHHDYFAKTFAEHDRKYPNLEDNARHHISAILANDIEHTKLKNYAQGEDLKLRD